MEKEKLGVLMDWKERFIDKLEHEINFYERTIRDQDCMIEDWQSRIAYAKDRKVKSEEDLKSIRKLLEFFKTEVYEEGRARDHREID